MTEQDPRADTPCVACWSETGTFIRGGEDEVMATLLRNLTEDEARDLMTKCVGRVPFCRPCGREHGVRITDDTRNGSGLIHFRRVA